MSKRMPLTISGLLTLTVIAYLGYEACIYHTTDSTLEDFLEVYLNNPQKYIFNGMIYGIPAIYSNVLLFRRTEILIRVKSTLLQRITLKSVKTSVLLGIYIFLIYIYIYINCIFQRNGYQILPRNGAYHLQIVHFLFAVSCAFLSHMRGLR